MDAEIKRKWVDALRSGKYRQCQDRLRAHDDSYCCLGVLCDVLGEQWENSEGEWCVAGRYAVKTMLNDALLKQCGLSPDAQSHAMGLNDRGESFLTIADWIEREL